jgi:putative ABC transport system ATP-binding protein
MLKLVDLSKAFAASEVRTLALDQINLEIVAGEYIAITGPSGCGKSTLLNVLGLIDTPTSGNIWFSDENVTGWKESRLNRFRRGRVGFIFQSFNLIEELSVFENIELALEYTGTSGDERRERVLQIMEQLSITHRAGHHPSHLSGGQQQRVAIARALVARPLILLADEPTGNLDSVHGDEVMHLLRSINAEGTTVIMVTHSMAHASQAARTLRMLDGRIIDDTHTAAR